MMRLVCAALIALSLGCSDQATLRKPASGKASAAKLPSSAEKEPASNTLDGDGKPGEVETAPSPDGKPAEPAEDDGKTDDKPDGKPEGELEVEDVEVDDVDETNVPPITGEKARLTIAGMRLDSTREAAVITITRQDGKAFKGTWPRRGETLEIEGVCDRPKIELKISIAYEGSTITPGPGACILGQQADKMRVNMGFEDPDDNCGDGTDYRRVDDAVAAWSCPMSELTVKDLTLNAGIDLARWVD